MPRQFFDSHFSSTQNKQVTKSSKNYPTVVVTRVGMFFDFQNLWFSKILEPAVRVLLILSKLKTWF
jgi:hypothetical protein